MFWADQNCRWYFLFSLWNSTAMAPKGDLCCVLHPGKHCCIRKLIEDGKVQVILILTARPCTIQKSFAVYF
uniref:Secreted protein n=1 Tax=Amazona collaria TaxID=241587 RepID=A0A8B9GHH6_9PSIT